jgi:hypothetical protein
MSTETHVFFSGPLPSKRALQGAIRELGFGFALTPATGRLEDQDGYMPMRFRREDTGVEFDVFDGREAVEEFADIGIDPDRFDRVANFRWSGDLVEAAAGQCSAAALANLVGGIVFDEAEDRLLSPDEAAKAARETVAAIPPPPPRRPGAKQSDLKRYLKPLLERRSDLMLTGRLLIIRPVRHLLRGAWFESSSDRTCFYLNWFAQPLAGGPWLHDRVATLYVDRPQFLPLFYHCLRKHVFERVGKITTLDAYRNTSDRTRTNPSNYMAPVFLAEGIEATRRLIAEGPIYDSEAAIERFNALSEQGMEALRQYYYDREADTVGELKIAENWERAPFPIEVPPNERDALTSETEFVTQPWMEFDPGWRAEMPMAAGEVRYANDCWTQCGETFLVGPISPEEARKLRSEIQSYVLSKRMQDGTLIVLQRRAESETLLGLLTPEAAIQRRLSYGDQYLRIERPEGSTLSAGFSSNFDRPEETCLTSVDVYDALGKGIWESRVYNYRGVSSVRDSRGEQVQQRNWEYSDDELAAVTLSNPEFDDYQSFVDCVTAFLKKNGNGVME